MAMMKKLTLYFPTMNHVPLRPGLYVLLALAVVSACSRPSNPSETKRGLLTALPFDSIGVDTLAQRIRSASDWVQVGNVFMGGSKGEVTTEKGSVILLHATEKNSVPSTLSLGVVHDDMDIQLDFMLGRRQDMLTISFKGHYNLILTGTNQLSFAGAAPAVDPSPAAHPMRHAILAPEAYRAPGLWQHLTARFKAPRFDAAGILTDSARIENIYLNGQHMPDRNVVYGGTAPENEKPGAPLAITVVGNVALRHIAYKAYTDERLSISNIQYTVYKGIFKEYDTLRKMTPVRTGATDSLHWQAGDKRSQITFKGTLHVPKAGGYLFRLRAGGPAWLLINDREVVNNHGTRDFVRPFYDSIKLRAGDHRVEIIYANYDQSLVIDYEGPGIPFTRLTAPTAERHEEAIEPLEYAVTTEPGVQRGFFMHRGKVNTYTMAIGIPGGLNYAYDINTYSLLSAWRGHFIDVSNMWTSRGESQRELPLGAVLELSGVPPVQLLAEERNVWQDTVAADKTPFANRSYRIEADGLPVFHYSFHGASIEDRWRASADGDGLERTVTVSNAADVADVYFLLGNGRKVEKLPQGGYMIDDKAYYLTEPKGVDGKALRIVTAGDGRVALMLPLAGPAGKQISFQYTILW